MGKSCSEHPSSVPYGEQLGSCSQTRCVRTRWNSAVVLRDSCNTVNDARMARANQVSRYNLSWIGVINLQADRAEDSAISRRYAFGSSLLVPFSRFRFATAIETFGVGTRITLPVSLRFHLWHCFWYCFCSTSWCQYHVQWAARPDDHLSGSYRGRFLIIGEWWTVSDVPR